MKSKLLWLTIPSGILLLLFSLKSGGPLAAYLFGSGGEEAPVSVGGPIPPPLQAWLKGEGPPIPQGEEVSLEEARRRAPFEIPLPTYVPVGVSLEKLYALPRGMQVNERPVALLYSNGMLILMYRIEKPVPWDLVIAQNPEVRFPITVNGFPGNAGESGQRRECVTNEYAPGRTETYCYDLPERFPSFVEWQAGNVYVQIKSYMAVQELLRIAESMDFGQPAQ